MIGTRKRESLFLHARHRIDENGAIQVVVGLIDTVQLLLGSREI